MIGRDDKENGMVAFLVAAVAVFVALVGVLVLASPASLVAFVSDWQSKTGLWGATLLRLLLGVGLWLVAPMARFPLAFQVLALLSLLGAVALPLIGLARFRAVLFWWTHQSPVMVRVWSALLVVFGVFVSSALYA
jgi:hypothetical protein